MTSIDTGERVNAATGLGWPPPRPMTTPESTEADPLGWPAGGSADTEPAAAAAPRAAAREVPTTPATGSMSDDLPMAAPIREELAAVVSRETEAAGAARTVSRETPATAPSTKGHGDETWPRPAARHILTVANQKGGVGKTTSTVNLAAALAQHGVRVLVIDLDPQGNASTAFGLEHRAGTPSVYDALVADRPLAELAVPVAGFTGLDCVPATIDLAGAEIELVAVVARESRLNRALKALETPYDVVFIDCPPSLGLLTVNALVAGREVLIPIQCEFYALEGLSQLLRNIDLVRAHLNPGLHISTILLTMYDGRTRLSDQVAQEVRTHFGQLVVDATIPRSVRISEAPGYGQSVLTYDPGSRGAVAYVDAARELAHRLAGADDNAGVGAGGGSDQ